MKLFSNNFYAISLFIRNHIIFFFNHNQLSLALLLSMTGVVIPQSMFS